MSTRKLSTAKLAYVPPAQTDRKTKPPGKGIWSRINFFSSTQNSPVQSKRSSSQISSTSRRSQDSASTFLETSSGDRSRVTSRTSSQSANEENPPTPLPRKSSLADSFFPEKARRESQKSSTQQSQLNGQSSSKNKTTVVVHMSQNNNFSNNPRFRNNNASHNQNFMQQFNSPRFANKEFQLNDKKKNESNRPPLARPIAANSANQWNNFVHPRRVSWETGRNQMQETMTNSRIISQNKPLHQLQQISGRNEERIFWTPTPEKRNHGSESNFQTDEQPRLTQSPRNSSWLNRNMQHRSTEDILSLNQSKGSFWENTNKIRSKSTWHINNEPNAIQEHRLNNQIMSRSSSNINELAPNLNSLQVFRQNKYKERHMAERNIRNHLHLQTNGHCSDLVQILGKGFNPGMYENTNHLGVVQQETKSSIITSSRIPIKAQIVEQKPKFPPVPRKPQFPREHIYAEIEENISPINTPTMHRRVTFSTIHNPLMETDQSFSDKKILPATLWGIVEVKTALRDRKDEERRNVARLCYHAIKMTAPDNSLNILGKIDCNRYGESIYVVLENSCFEIRDGEGLIIAKHRSKDISVITEINGDPNVFVYIGRCKFSGRIGMVLKFNKNKHLGIVVEFFKNGLT